MQFINHTLNYFFNITFHTLFKKHNNTKTITPATITDP